MPALEYNEDMQKKNRLVLKLNDKQTRFSSRVLKTSKAHVKHLKSLTRLDCNYLLFHVNWGQKTHSESIT